MFFFIVSVDVEFKTFLSHLVCRKQVYMLINKNTSELRQCACTNVLIFPECMERVSIIPLRASILFLGFFASRFMTDSFLCFTQPPANDQKPEIESDVSLFFIHSDSESFSLVRDFFFFFTVKLSFGSIKCLIHT